MSLAGHRHALFIEYQQGKEAGNICLLAEHKSEFIHSVYSDSDDCMISSNITLFWHSIGYRNHRHPSAGYYPTADSSWFRSQASPVFVLPFTYTKVEDTAKKNGEGLVSFIT